MPKINIDGITREMTPAEIAEMERLSAEIAEMERLSAEFQPPEDPNEKRMNEIEAALIELAAMLGGA